MSELVTVRILGMPLDVMQRSAEHGDELLWDVLRQIDSHPPGPWSTVMRDAGLG